MVELNYYYKKNMTMYGGNLNMSTKCFLEGIEVKGKYNKAKVFTENINQETISQVFDICNLKSLEGSNIRIMPDCHKGKGCVIGTTLIVGDSIIPNIVGVDIGCGVTSVKLDITSFDFNILNNYILENIPFGMNYREKAHKFFKQLDLTKLKSYQNISKERAELSLGSLGGGNHFIEIGKVSDGSLYLTVHSGSRYLGKQVAKYYQAIAVKQIKKRNNYQIIKELKRQGRENDIEKTLKEINKNNPKYPKELAHIEGSFKDDYLEDIQLVQKYASLNRMAIIDDIISYMGWSIVEKIESIHNYIEEINELDLRILRKGAISSKQDEKVVIPINMRDGLIIGKGLGNPEWNYSAPHGAGRILSRGKAKDVVSLDDFEKSMKDVFSTCVNLSTVDESPFVYKSMEEILFFTRDTIELVDVAKPIYNFKG